MSKKISDLRPIIVMAVVITVAISLRVKQHVQESRPTMAEITVGGHVFHAEVANTPAKQELGLGNRDALSTDAAMYFPMSGPSRWIFWMKNMRFPIDIVWINENRVIDISANVPVPTEGQELTTYSPANAADAVLEISAGQAGLYGIDPGAGVEIRVVK